MKNCVFAGSFDPLTVGHMHVIEKCSMMFDDVIVGIGINPAKKYTYNLKQRLEMLAVACARFRNVTIEHYESNLADFMRLKNSKCLVRGQRSKQEVEDDIKLFNSSNFDDDVELMFFQPPKNLMNVSSTAVKQLLKVNKSADKLIPEEIVSLIKSYNVKFK